MTTDVTLDPGAGAEMAPGAQPIERRSLTDQLVSRLRELIVEGDLPAGHRLRERELCERYRVSRTPLREALKVLATEDLLELLPNRGARVAALTAEDVDAVFPVMGALEALAGELAAERITEAALAEVRALHYQMVLHYRRGELAPYYRLNQQIHERVLAAAGNPVLASLYRTLTGRVRRSRYQGRMSAERWSQAVAEHEGILAALDRRDGQALGHLLKAHLQTKSETVKEALAAERDAQ
jgi:DNA-binding GntR family transcriptional regulator